jgi:phytanoyl-CoA hydroxylase
MLSIHNVQYHSATFTKMMVKQQFTDILADLMETNNIQLHHTKAHIKPPKHGSRFPMHQDYHYFPHAKHSMVAVFIHLEDAEVENGCLAVYPGSHKLGPLPDFGSEGYHYVDPEKFPIEKATPVTGKKGQVVIFPYTLVHGSYPNISDTPRRMLLFQLRATDDYPTKEIHISPGQVNLTK